MAEYQVIKDKLTASGLTVSASDWIIKALSPATPTGKGCLIPDSSCAPVAVPEYVYSETIPAYGSGSWDLLLITPPTYPTLMYAVAAAAGFDYANTVWQPGTNCTIYTVNTEASTSALLVPNLMNALIWGSSSITPGTAYTIEPSTQPLMWRRAYSSLTAYLVASDLNNQGTITSGQYPGRVSKASVGQYVSSAPGLGIFHAYDLLEIPLNEVNMTAMNPKVRVAPAKQGVYQPAYNKGPTFEWAAPAGMPALVMSLAGAFSSVPGIQAGGPTGAAALGSLVAPNDPTSSVIQSGWLTALANTQANTVYSYGTDNTMTGVSLWRGLSNGASVTCKVVVGLEIQAGPQSPIRQFNVPAADYEPRALQVYYDLVHDMPHTYPASSNFLNMVLSAASALLPSVLPAVAGFITRGLAPYVPARTDQPEMAGSAVSFSRPRAVMPAERAVRAMAPPRKTPKKKKQKKVRILRSSSAGSRGSRGGRRG